MNRRDEFVDRPDGAPFLLWLLLGLASWGLLLGLIFGGIAVGRLL